MTKRFCYSHDGRVRQRIYAILTTVMCYSHSTDKATSAKKVQSNNLTVNNLQTYNLSN